jgi:hypothetical protein
MSAEASWISQNYLLRTDYAILAFTSIIFIARVVVQVWRRNKFEWQDGWLYIAFAAYLALCITYTHITPTFFKLEQLAKGENLGWEGMHKDIRLTTEVIFTSGIMFWTCLWCVKFSLLALYKKLLVGVSYAWTYTYWSIVLFCVLVRGLALILPQRRDLIAHRHTSATLPPAQLLHAIIPKSYLTRATRVRRLRKSGTRLLACTTHSQWMQ